MDIELAVLLAFLTIAVAYLVWDVIAPLVRNDHE